MQSTHELALTFATGEVRHPDLETCHSRQCTTRACSRPSHLRFDTHQSNVDDAVATGTHARGVANGHAKLSESDVLVMRKRAASGATGKTLSVEYGVSQGLVTEILRGRRWTHVGGPLRDGHGNIKHGNYRKRAS